MIHAIIQAMRAKKNMPMIHAIHAKNHVKKIHAMVHAIHAKNPGNDPCNSVEKSHCFMQRQNRYKASAYARQQCKQTFFSATNARSKLWNPSAQGSKWRQATSTTEQKFNPNKIIALCNASYKKAISGFGCRLSLRILSFLWVSFLIMVGFFLDFRRFSLAFSLALDELHWFLDRNSIL